MDHRYRNPRPRSPTLYNPARASLPVNLAYSEHQQHHHFHAVPTVRREVIPISVSQPRGSTDRVNLAGPVTTTTYKIKAEPARVREPSRTRRATMDSQNIPTVITSIAAPPIRHRPVVHGNSGRSSPIGNPYRSSGEDQYYAVPASSGKTRHHHARRYSATVDNGDINRIAREHNAGRLPVVNRGREGQGQVYNGGRPQSMYTNAVVRHTDNVQEYGDDEYGYTNPKDLVQYDLNNNERRHHQRRDSQEGGRPSRPASINSYEQVSRSYDTRERGPPPSTRGFAQVNARTWPVEPVRMPVPPPPPMDPVQRPASARPMEPIQRPASARPVESVRRPMGVEPPFGDTLLTGEPHQLKRRVSASSRRPVSVYQERDRRPQRDEGREYHDPRDEDLRRERRHRKEPSRDEVVEQRGFGVRPERSDRDDRLDRVDRPDRMDRNERVDRPERVDRVDRVERVERTERSDHKSGRDVLTAGLSTAAAALGLGAMAKKSSRDDSRDERDDREERARREEREDRREEREEQRRRRDREEREAEREAKDRPSHRDDRDPAPSHDRTVKTPREETFLDPSVGKDRHNSRDDRDLRKEESRRHLDSRDDSPVSDETTARSRKNHSRRPSGAAASFNPRDALDLKALKEELNSKAGPPIPPKEPLDSAPVNQSQPRDVVDNKTEIRDDRGRLGPLAPSANKEDRQLRVVSPPREAQAGDKPVKGILRQPRDKFPEDPSPIREGVAPLKDAKKDGVPPDARWTKISRKLVNPDALEAGKERYEAREDFVIVLRVLSRDEVQAYAVATQQIRAAREEVEDREASEQRRRARRERHERHKRERAAHERGESTHRSSRRHRHQDSPSDSQSDETTDDERPKMLEQAPPRDRGGIPGQVPQMSGALGDLGIQDVPGSYPVYSRNPGHSSTAIPSALGSRRRDE